MRVLIVDEEPPAQEALAAILATQGDVEHFDCAGDSTEALARMEYDEYDVLLLEVRLPPFSGIELVERLQRRPKPMPAVIFVTAHAEYAVVAFEKHAVDYVLKPFSPARIRQALAARAHAVKEER